LLGVRLRLSPALPAVALGLLAGAALPASAAAVSLPLPKPAPSEERATTTPVPPPPPPVQPGRAAIRVATGLATRRVRYVYRGQLVRVVGRVFPFVAGQVVVVEVVRRGRVVRRLRAPVRQGRRGRGRFSVRFLVRRTGRVRVVAKHAATPRQAAFRSNSKRFRVVRWAAGGGAGGTRVRLLQAGLRRLGYAVPVNGYYGAATSRAVLAYRKVNGMGRVGFASRRVYAKVFRRRGRFGLRYPRAGRHVEFDWSRQVLVLARRGRAYATYHASSGKPSTPTPFGTFRFYSKQWGVNSVGMVHSSYFLGGYAIHGYPSVPTFPASHGCIRVPIPNSLQIARWIPNGMRIFIYR
jgi:hypothetical protein